MSFVSAGRGFDTAVCGRMSQSTTLESLHPDQRNQPKVGMGRAVFRVRREQ